MGELDTYEIAHFIPFTAEVYERLYIRHNEAWTPLPLLTLALGFLALRAAWHHRGRLLGALLAPAWIWVCWSFLWQLYRPLNWAGEGFAYAFFAQALILLALALTGRLDGAPLDGAPIGDRTRRFGLAIALYGLLLHPLQDPLAGRPWTGAELFGHAPEPTAIVTLGLMLIAARPRWPTIPIPLAWCAIAAATTSVLGGPLGLVSPAVAALAVIGAMVAWIGRR